jgi:transaldolase
MDASIVPQTAAWAIPYVNRAARLVDEGHTLMQRLRATRDATHTPLELIGASIKSVGEAVQAIANGADTVSLPRSVLEQLPAHPLTETAIAEFSSASQSSESR